MKKTITRADGTTEVVEGTADEIAEYERKIRGEVKESPKSAPGLLTEEKVRKILEGMQSIPPVQILTNPVQHSNFCEVVVAQRGWMSINPPRCNCGASPSYYEMSPLTWSVTSNNFGGIITTIRPKS